MKGSAITLRSTRVESTLHAALAAPGPLYKQVKDRIIKSLARGEWTPGGMLPSEAQLAARYGVAVSTLRAAIGQLVAARVLTRKQGKGTFVAFHNELSSIHQFFHVVRNDGARQPPVSTLLSLKRIRASDDVADLLRLPHRGRDVFQIRNVLKVAGTPVVASAITVACSRLPGLNRNLIREGGDTLYAVYQNRYGINIVGTVEKLRAVRTDAAAAKIFGLPQDEPILQIQRIAYTFDQVPVELRRSSVDTRNFFYLFDQSGAAG